MGSGLMIKVSQKHIHWMCFWEVAWCDQYGAWSERPVRPQESHSGVFFLMCIRPTPNWEYWSARAWVLSRGYRSVGNVDTRADSRRRGSAPFPLLGYKRYKELS